MAAVVEEEVVVGVPPPPWASDAREGVGELSAPGSGVVGELELGMSLMPVVEFASGGGSFVDFTCVERPGILVAVEEPKATE